MSELYRQIGLIAAPGPVAFVGNTSAFASSSPDTTLLLVSISLPNRALTFTREGEYFYNDCTDPRPTGKVVAYHIPQDIPGALEFVESRFDMRSSTGGSTRLRRAPDKQVRRERNLPALFPHTAW